MFLTKWNIFTHPEHNNVGKNSTRLSNIKVTPRTICRQPKILNVFTWKICWGFRFPVRVVITVVGSVLLVTVCIFTKYEKKIFQLKQLKCACRINKQLFHQQNIYIMLADYNDQAPLFLSNTSDKIILRVYLSNIK